MESCNLLILCVLFVVTSLNAQTDFRPGYIIKAEGDSLFGEIDYRNENIMSQVCKFRKSKKDKEQKFYPNEILGYRFPESKYYVSKKYNEKTSFFEFLVKGKISFYYSFDSDGEHYFVEKENEPLFEITGKEEIEKIKEKNIFVESTKHIGVLTYLMQDAPTLQPEINKIQSPDNKNLIDLAVKYQKIVCNDEKCIVYQKPPLLLKIVPEVNFGTMRFIDSSYPNTSVAGALVNISFSSFNEKIYFRTGLQYNLETRSSESMVCKIPLQIEYIYPTGIIQPKAALGYSLFLDNSGFPEFTNTLMAGVNIKVWNSLYLTINYDFDFLIGANLFQPISHLVSAGMSVRL